MSNSKNPWHSVLPGGRGQEVPIGLVVRNVEGMSMAEALLNTDTCYLAPPPKKKQKKNAGKLSKFAVKSLKNLNPWDSWVLLFAIEALSAE